MRIVLLMNSLFTGGAEFSSLTFLGWLQKQGHQVKVVVLKTAEPSFEVTRFGFDGITVLKGLSLWSRFQELKVIVKSFQPAFVHSVLFDANMLGRMLRLTNHTFIHLESLVNEMYSQQRYADPHVTRIKLIGYCLLDGATQIFGVDHFHANGDSVAHHYQEKLFINSKRITVIPRGREANSWLGNEENRNRVRTQLKTGSRLLFINMARHEYQKGQDVLMDALALLGNAKDKIQVVIVGREGKLTSVLRDKMKFYQLKDVVTLLGHRDDAGSLLAAADGFIFPSRFEGLPGALIEAEAAGLPLVCSDIPNNREVASENVCALMFPINDAKVLAHQLEKLISDEGLRARMGKASLTNFEKHFALEEIHQKMFRLLEKLLK